jgi:pimeloyl-ACP methyl ester carboxylesterase
MTDLVVREYGTGLDTVIAVHGGPAAAGDLAPLAGTLGQRWYVLEPYQRGHGDQPLTVSTHVEDLDRLIRQRCTRPPILVGHSWGAMLVLAYAAANPKGPAALVLIGCGAFSATVRSEFTARFAARLTSTDRAELAGIAQSITDPDRRRAAEGRVATRVYGYDLDGLGDWPPVDATAHRETWTDMLRLIEEGFYPSAFAAIACPVLMIHGIVDPHPGGLIRDELRTYVPHLEYVELPRCGHSPWLERQARADFYHCLTTWIAARWTAPQAG